MFADALAPLIVELVEIDVFGFLGAGGECCDLAGAPGVAAECGEVRFDVLAPGGETAERVRPPGGELGESAGGRCEAPAEPLTDLVTEVGAVGVADRELPSAQEGLGVERAPFLVVAALAFGRGWR